MEASLKAGSNDIRRRPMPGVRVQGFANTVPGSQVLIFAKRQCPEIIENLQGGRALCHLGLNKQPLVSG
jgi:hypothetical protein